MSDFIHLSTAIDAGAPAWLSSVRENSLAVWQRFSMPNRKTEDWKYTNLSILNKHNFFVSKVVSEERAVHANTYDDSLFAIPGLDTQRITFVNGEYAPELSLLDDDAALEICRFSDANEEQKSVIASKLNTAVNLDKHGFCALNSTRLVDGVFVRAKKNQRVNKPVQIVWIDSANETASSVFGRLLVIVESGAELSVLEQHVSANTTNTSAIYASVVSEVFLEENAKLTHYRLQSEQENLIHIGGVFAQLDSNARFNSFYLVFGSVLKRLDIDVRYMGPGAEATIKGVYLPKDKQHVDVHSCIEHAVPYCTTNEVFRGIIADQARAVFNGRIHIHPDAQKTEAFLSNKNLLTSNKAEVDTKPELEIYADDVRCAHGATVAQLDPLALHYLKTRGVSEAKARVMLSFGFINELVSELTHVEISNYLRPVLAATFAHHPALMEHLL
jgi:Fe-S cluster assembly protein SufD